MWKTFVTINFVEKKHQFYSQNFSCKKKLKKHEKIIEKKDLKSVIDF